MGGVLVWWLLWKFPRKGSTAGLVLFVLNGGFGLVEQVETQ